MSSIVLKLACLESCFHIYINLMIKPIITRDYAHIHVHKIVFLKLTNN